MDKEKTLLVHRKGSTRAFGPGHDELPARYRETGQPVIIGGSMETGSYLLVGTTSGSGTFFSTAHGSGRTMSRSKAPNYGTVNNFSAISKRAASMFAALHGQVSRRKQVALTKILMR